MNKFRIRLPNGRVMGPFDKKELFDLKNKGHIKGHEECQDYPTGNWLPINSFEFYEELMDENKTILNPQEAPENTFIIDLAKIKRLKQEKELEKYENISMAPAEQLTETVRLPEEKKIESNKSEININEKTTINLNLNQTRNEAIPTSPDTNEILTETDDSTQIINLEAADLLKNASEIEDKLDKEFIEANNSDNIEEDNFKKSKKKWIYLAAAGALFFAILFPDEKNVIEFKKLETQIEFPIPFDYSDEKKSIDFFQKGMKIFQNTSFESSIESGVLFKKSYENNIDNHKALGMLVRSYGEQMTYADLILEDAQTLFNLVQTKRSLLIQDPNGVIGMNLFYEKIGKTHAAADVIQKYLKLYPQNVTQDLFCFYLKTLLRLGKLDYAKNFYLALDKAEEKNTYAYLALIDYLVMNEETDRAIELASRAIEKNPNNVDLLLLHADLLLKKRVDESAADSLKKVESLGFGFNNIHRAKFYELKGLYFVLKNKPREAAESFSTSLKIKDSQELRLMLADIDESSTSDDFSMSLIKESKSAKHLIEARDFFDKKRYELAMSSAARAVDEFPKNIDARIFLAEVQLKLGLSLQGLKTIEALSSEFSDNSKVNLALIRSYINTFNFSQARKRLQALSVTEFGSGWEYASLNAQLFEKSGDLLQAMSWYKRSIDLNPLNDKDVFNLADLLLKKANFESAKIFLLKCMELDPLNPEYRIAYARYLYETQDDRAAIGYLLNLKDDFGDDPQIISEIAILYYRSGKIKDFQDYKAKLEKEHNTHKTLYEFLIKSALLDERNLEVPDLVEKLIQLEPNDYQSMMTAGRVLFEEGKLVESAYWFKKIRDKLPTYPKVLYYMAKIDFLSGDQESALAKIEEDMKINGEYDDGLVFMAQIFMTKEKFVEAENFFKKAQKINPKSYDAVVGLADLSVMRSNHDFALDLYKRATKLREDEPIIHKKIGDVYRKIGQGTLAIEAYKLYLDMDPESPHKKNLEAYINLMQ